MIASLFLVASGAAPAIIGNTQKYNAVQEEIYQQQQQSIDDKAKRAAELQARIQAKMSGKVSVDVLECISENEYLYWRSFLSTGNFADNFC